MASIDVVSRDIIYRSFGIREPYVKTFEPPFKHFIAVGCARDSDVIAFGKQCLFRKDKKKKTKQKQVEFENAKRKHAAYARVYT